MMLLRQLFSCEEWYSITQEASQEQRYALLQILTPKHFTLKLWSLAIRSLEMETATVCFKLLDFQITFLFLWHNYVIFLNKQEDSFL